MGARKLQLVVLCFLLFSTVRHLHAQQQSDSGTQAASAVAALEKLQLKQDKVANCVDARMSLHWKDVTIAYGESGLQLSGITSQNAHWTAIAPASGVFTCEVWAANLYKGASPSLLIFSGSHDPEGYGSELTILSFDSMGLPVPWQAVGHFNSNKSGIMQLISQGDGKSSLILSKREGDRLDGFAYVHDLIEINAAGFTKINGNRLSSNWPIITGNLKSLSGTEHNQSLTETFSEHSGQSDVITLKSVVLPNPSTGVGGITLSDGTQSMFPLMLQVDATDGSRNIYIAGDVPETLQNLIKKTYSARLVGQTCEEEECRPLLLIATEQ